VASPVVRHASTASSISRHSSGSIAGSLSDLTAGLTLRARRYGIVKSRLTFRCEASLSRGNPGEEGTNLTIVAALMALFADHVFGLVASGRGNYLVEFNDYLYGRGLRPRPTAPTTRA
jgi:hypothetical protein